MNLIVVEYISGRAPGRIEQSLFYGKVERLSGASNMMMYPLPIYRYIEVGGRGRKNILSMHIQVEPLICIAPLNSRMYKETHPIELHGALQILMKFY